jgi:serpin B
VEDIAAVIVAGLAGGCSSDSGKPSTLRSDVARESASSGDPALASGAVRAFGWPFLPQIAPPTKNAVFSPYGISVATAMLSAGAANRTLEQIQSALRFPEVGDPLHRSENALDQALEARNTTTEPGQILTRSNDLWMQSSFAPRKAFLDTLARFYGAGVYTVDFANNAEGARRAINDRVAADTHGLIPELVDAASVGPSTDLVLTNGVYFAAHFRKEFSSSNTASGPFADVDGGTVQLDMMHMKDDFAHASMDGFQMLALPYMSRDLEIDFILPPPGDFAAQMGQLDSERVDSLVTAAQYEYISLSLPKVAVTTRVPLAAELKRAGMTDAFGSSADFSPLADGVHLTRAVHQATLSVDEHGTTAAAGTAFGGTAGTAPIPPPPIPFYLNRPFAFLLRDVSTNTPLFIGQYVGPSGG